MSVHSWNNCPNEILCQIFSKLEARTLVICMQVSSKWKDVAYYIVGNQHGGLEKVLTKRLEDGGMIYKIKSNINFGHSYLNSLLWYNICNAQVHYVGPVVETQIRHISVYKDNVIIVNNDGVTYYDADTLKLRRHFKLDCNHFEESDYMVVTQKSTTHRGKKFLFIYSKRNIVDFTFTRNPAFNVTVEKYKFHEDRCYVIKETGQISTIIWRAEGEIFTLGENPLGRYYGSMSNVAAMHVSCKTDLYIILRNGNVLRCDTNRIAPLTKIFDCDLFHSNIPLLVITFHRFGAVFKTSSNSKFDVKYYEEMDFMVLQCPGLTCAIDHGNILFLGYDNGEVQIFIKSKLMKGNKVPERTINMNEYCARVSPCPIRLIEVHEKMYAHILFIATDSVTIKLLIYNQELINCIKDVTDIDQTCLSIVHLLSIEE